MRPDARDPLADVLSLLRPQALLAAELRARGRWRLAFDSDPRDVKFGLVIEGECLLAIRGRRVETLGAGDFFLLGGAPPYMMASDLAAPSRRASDVLHHADRRVARIGDPRGKSVVHAIGGRFLLEASHAHLLVEAMPVFVRIPAHEAGALRGVTQLLVEEVRGKALGRRRALDQLAQLVLTYALRWLDSEGERSGRTGWLRALADPRIGAALRHIHENVAKGISLAELARVAGMSRTAFAAHFRALVGQPPLDYSIDWRMSLAKDALRTTDRAIGALAFEVGYESESAFSMAFRRKVGCSPRAYRLRSTCT